MTSRKRSVLFVSGSADDNVVLNWIGQPAEKLSLYAEAFHRAGRKLADGYGTTGASRDFEACPVVFLYRHALELYLKAILVPGEMLLRLRSEPRIDLRSHLINHRLIDLLPDYERVIAAVGWGWDMGVDGLRSREELRALLGDFDRVDQRSYSFRYPIDKNGKATLPDNFSFSISAFAARMDSLLEVLDGAVMGIEAAVDGEREQRAEYESWYRGEE